ncbi:MAG: hypothetical protein IJ241_01745, partial [Clostridia bacterium]|nr:hypothetical protein [Clostridia bacterium]
QDSSGTVRAKEVEKVSFPQYNSKKEEEPSQDGDYTILTRPHLYDYAFFRRKSLSKQELSFAGYAEGVIDSPVQPPQRDLRRETKLFQKKRQTISRKPGRILLFVAHLW